MKQISNPFIEFCHCLDKAAVAEKAGDYDTMWFYVKQAKIYPATADFHKWLLSYSQVIYKFLYEPDANKAVLTRELLILRKEAGYKPENIEHCINSVYRYVKDSYILLLFNLLREYSSKMGSLPEYEELCLELYEIMEKEQWLQLPGENYYLCVHMFICDYYIQSGRFAAAGYYYEKIWQKYKDEKYISANCFVAINNYVNNLLSQGNMDKAKEVYNFLMDKVFDGHIDGFFEENMEGELQKFFSEMIPFLEMTGHSENIIEIIESMLDCGIFDSEPVSYSMIQIYFYYMYYLNRQKKTCSFDRQHQIGMYLKKYQEKTDLMKVSTSLDMYSYIVSYYLCKMQKNKKAFVYLEQSASFLIDSDFGNMDNRYYIIAIQIVVYEYRQLGYSNKAVEYAELFMQKNISFYATAEFYTDNVRMEQYLEICGIAFQCIYYAVCMLVSKEKKFTYSLNYKQILSSVLRMRNRIGVLDDGRLRMREKNPDELAFFSLEKLKEIMPENTVLIELLYIEPEIYKTGQRKYDSPDRQYQLEIFVLVNKQGQCMLEYKSIPDARDLNENVMALLDKMRSGGGKIKRQAEVVYRELFSGLEYIMQDIKHLWICPDGVLCNLSFDAFFDLAGELSFADYTYWQSLRDIFEVWEEGDSALSCMIGNPKFSLEETDGIQPANEEKRWAFKQLKPLPYSGYEALKLSIFMEGRCFTGGEATKFVIEAGYRYLHIATHGFNQGSGCSAWYDSMLAFSGAQDFLNYGGSMAGYGNGFLSAEEISKINLSGTEAVVLSACGSGSSIFSKYKHQTGLHIAFSVAGVKYVVSALWEVDDFPTAVLMSYFYENMREGIQVPAALAKAKRQLRNTSVEVLMELVNRDKNIMPDSYNELLSTLSKLPAEYCCYSSPWYWGSFICTRAMY